MKWIIKEDGVTLVELMVVLVISAFLMAVVYTAYLTQNKTSYVQHQVITMQQDLRAAIDIMERDIRMAGCDPLDQSTAGIIVSGTGAAAIFVTMDINDDGDTGDTNEQAAYALSGTTLLRNNQTLAENVTSMGFTYLDSNNNTISLPITAGNVGSIRTVVINIMVQSEQTDPDTGQYLTRTLTRRVRCRNLGL